MGLFILIGALTLVPAAGAVYLIIRAFEWKYPTLDGYKRRHKGLGF